VAKHLSSLLARGDVTAGLHQAVAEAAWGQVRDDVTCVLHHAVRDAIGAACSARRHDCSVQQAYKWRVDGWTWPGLRFMRL
jgi:hypothetical protein